MDTITTPPNRELRISVKKKEIRLYEDDAQVATSVDITVVRGQPFKNGKPIYATDFPDLTSLGLDATDLTLTYTESDEDEGSFRLWKDPEGVLFSWRKCSQCQQDYIASAASDISTCSQNCRRNSARSVQQEKRAKAKASAEEEATKSLIVFVCEICQHECKTQAALDNHIRLNHKE